MKKLVIIGAGGYGQMVYDIADQSGKYEKIIFLDDNSDLACGKCDEWVDYLNEYDIYPAFGNNEKRLSFVEKILKANGNVPTIIHKSAYVSPMSKIDVGCVVMPMAAVNTNTVIEKGCIINTSSIIDHGSIIEKGCHICLGAVVKAENRIKSLTKVQAGEIIEDRTYPV
ncbi:MAG: hypothetical protein K5768_08205 [Firmicutes bacterium]|nr:hypothetical protein [Bacillota bacterium]